MSYIHIPNFKNNRRFVLLPLPIKIVISVGILLSLLHFLAPNFLPSFFTTIISPLWRMGEGNENVPFDVARMEKDALLKENEELKDFLGRASDTHPLLAIILKKPPFSAYDVFILDIGKDAKVEKGDKVYAPVDKLPNIPIGEIAEVYGSTAKAKLYSSSGEKFDVLIGSSSIQTTATGRGGGTFEVVVPRDTKIVSGDKVSIPSLYDGIMGIVEDIVSEPSEPFSKVIFRQPLNIYELKWVIILHK